MKTKLMQMKFHDKTPFVVLLKIKLHNTSARGLKNWRCEMEEERRLMVKAFAFLGFSFMVLACGSGSTIGVERPAVVVPVSESGQGEVGQSGVLEQDPEGVQDPQLTMEGTLDQTIRLLQAREYHRLVLELLHPDDLKKIHERDGGVDGLVQDFSASEKPKELLEILMSVRGTSPVLSEQGDDARFHVEGKGNLRLGRVDGRWYLMNN